MEAGEPRRRDELAARPAYRRMWDVVEEVLLGFTTLSPRGFPYRGGNAARRLAEKLIVGSICVAGTSSAAARGHWVTALVAAMTSIVIVGTMLLVDRELKRGGAPNVLRQKRYDGSRSRAGNGHQR